jgi:type I restriction enzyme, S subunit
MMDASTVAQQDSSFIPRTSSLSTRRFQPYPEYKDSGVEWLGEIPVHWEATRLKFLTGEPLKFGANEAAELNDPDLPRYIRITDIRADGSLRDETFKSLPEETAAPYFLEQGDILFARSGARLGKRFDTRQVGAAPHMLAI